MNARGTELLRDLYACQEAREWAATQPSLRVAWARCQRGDWLLWLAARLPVPRELLVLAAVACAREVLCLVPDDVDEPRVSLERAELWALGEVTLDEVREARDHCWNRRWELLYDACAAAAAAADAAAYAAADAAADADADAVAYAAADADADARSSSLARSADIVREQIPWPIMDAAIKERCP